MEFVVRVPAWTPANSAVFVTGSRRELGLWRPDAVRLRRHRDGTWRGRVRLEDTTPFQFKITLGRWDRVEKDAQGRDIPNREWSTARGETLQVEVKGWGEPYVAPHTVVGELHAHERFYSRHLRNTRTVWVWVPPDYAVSEDVRYPVLYMHDGQNLFDAARAAFGVEWGVDEACWEGIRAGTIRPCIVVGLENTPDRFGEYTPTAAGGVGGRAPEYGRMIVEEVKELVDSTYRTLPDVSNTFVAGSSLGGLVSLFLLREYPDVFGGCGAVSPSLWWDGESFLKEAERAARWAKGKRVWLDMGTAESGWGNEGAHVVRTLRMKSALVRAGLREGEDLICRIVEGADHSETAWSRRVGDMIRHLIGPPRLTQRGPMEGAANAVAPDR